MCTKHHGGELTFTGKSYATLPPVYKHWCTEGYEHQWLPRTYPRVAGEEVESGS